MHTFMLVFSLCLWMEDYAARMYQLCLTQGTGFPEVHGITVSMKYHSPVKAGYPFEGADIRIFVDCLKFLGKRNMEAADVPVIRDALEAVTAPLGIGLEELALERIDYCYNAFVPDPDKRKLLMDLWHKASRTFKKAERVDPKRSKRSRTENTIYYQCKNDAYRVQLYNKESERADKAVAVMPYEMGALRLEYQLRREHLLYHWRNYGTPRSYDIWAAWDKRSGYLKSTERLFFSGDFYTLRKAETLLHRAGLGQRECREIRQFMANISRSGVDYAVRQAGSLYFSNKYINQLTNLGINPIPIPQNAGTPYMANPFREFYERGCA